MMEPAQNYVTPGAPRRTCQVHINNSTTVSWLQLSCTSGGNDIREKFARLPISHQVSKLEKNDNIPGLTSRILTCTVLKWHWRCFSFFFWLRVLDKAEYSAFESTLNSFIVSYSIVICYKINLKRYQELFLLLVRHSLKLLGAAASICTKMQWMKCFVTYKHLKCH